ncbi:DUF3616 domain-containing protein [Reyranella sp.]|uniref:DUF3616 domain-containing protein n=1 Tax=Reyranella sp. TaxID=1929291 RepID=UPI003BAB3139
MRSLVLTILIALHGTAALAEDQPTVYRGACDGSAAVRLDKDHFVAANDDENSLRIYRFGNPAPLPSVVDLNDALKPDHKKGKFKEVDIEGAARIDDRIYWIASHGRTGKGKKDPSRHRFFATDVILSGPSAPSVLPAAQPYTDLLKHLIKLPKLDLDEASERAPEDEDGLNIEGLAAARNGGLLIGLRNPLPKGKAIVIPFINPDAVLDRGAAPEFGNPEKLDLGGRGIRSIEFIGDRYLIVAGPFDDGDHDFAMYSWSGKSGDQPQPARAVAVGPVRQELLFSFKPEALFATADDKVAYLLSDDGTGACKDEKDPGRRTFRGIAVRLVD